MKKPSAMRACIPFLQVHAAEGFFISQDFNI
jgi:hypothetical protein